MSKKTFPIETVKLEKIVGGGQTVGSLTNGQRVFVWGGLPGETVKIQITKRKAKMSEGLVTEVIKTSDNRVEPKDLTSFLSTSPWQIMNNDSERSSKISLINEAFELAKIKLPQKIQFFEDNNPYYYRNKVEFSWWWDKNRDTLDLAFFKRGSHNKTPVDGTGLAKNCLNIAGKRIRDLLRAKKVSGRDLKTLLLRCDQQDNVVAQLYIKTPDFLNLTEKELKKLDIQGFEVIYSDSKSPASVITKRLQAWGNIILTDDILGTSFSYTAESFFQINLPVYEQALQDMKKWVDHKRPTIDLYSGVGTIGLTIGSRPTILIESNEHAATEMKKNIKTLKQKEIRAILSPSEKVLEYIDNDSNIIVDPPRAGLHNNVVQKILQTTPPHIIYLSCNPVTQARDVAKLLEKYQIKWQCGYNFFPRTPHVENLIILDKIS